MPQSNESLKILHIVISIGETSSPYNEHCLPWADDLNISICTYYGSALKPPPNIKVFSGDGSLSGFIRTLKSALIDQDYDVIHAHSPHMGLLYLLTTAFSSRSSPPPTVITVHDSYPNFKLRNRLMLLPVFATFRRIVCCSQASYASFPTLYKQLAGDRLVFVQNGLDISRVDRIAVKKHKPVHARDPLTIVAVSRLVYIKNPFAILTAFQRSADQNCRLVYIGDGPLRQSLLAQKQQEDSSNQIEFTGLISREKVFEFLLKADLFISASRGEGLPVSVLEAMSCRCPVLLSDIPPHREIAEQVDFIPLIQPDDLAGFGREIKKFSEMSVSERQIIGEKCRKLVEERFSLHAMHSGYLGIYDQITNNQGASVWEMVG